MNRFAIPALLIIGVFLTSFVPNPDNQLLPTSLRITVLNELGNTEEGATVTIYANENDYKKEENPVMEGQKTDKKGRITFKGLKPQIYFVNVEKGEKNNYGAGVQTDVLEEGRINKVNIIIE